MEYNSIDLVKFVMALCVVTIHTSYFDTIEYNVVREPLIALIRSAVPFFFMCSSYFIVKKISVNRGGLYHVMLERFSDYILHGALLRFLIIF